MFFLRGHWVDSRNGVTIASSETETSLNVGDTKTWSVSAAPNPEILSAGEMVSERVGEDDVVGAPEQLSFEFKALAAGETAVEFEYMFQGDLPEDASEQKSAAIQVTVR